jgi:hypothetical protein
MISHADVVKTYLGLLCLGKSDFEAAEGVAGDDWFKEALDIQKVPSQETLRQRFDRQAKAFERLAEAANIELLKRTQVPVTALPTGHVPLDLDVFCLDNSDTKKEGVSRTYQNYDGYAPIGAYLSEEGWCLGIELRRHPNVSFIVRWNPRRAYVFYWGDRAFREGCVSEPRPGKKVAIFSTWVTRHYGGRTYRFGLVIRVTERISDAKGQMLIQPDITLEGWWTSLCVHEDQVIRVHEKRGLSEQFHSEIKSDLDLERLPSGKFATNALVLTLGGLAYNLLRILGQNGLLADFSPVRHQAKRRRVKTVIQELIYPAGRVIRSGRRLKLQFGRHCPAFQAFRSVYLKFCPG